MGISIYGPVMESGLFAGTARGEVLRTMANIASDETAELYAGYEYMAFQAGCARETVIRETRMLIDAGLVTLVTQGGGRSAANRYRVNVDALEACKRRVYEAKKAAGNDPAKRLKAMTEARARCVELIEKGDLRSLLQRGNSDLDDGKGDLDDGKGDPRSPKPYLRTSLGKDARAGAGGDPDGPPAPRGGDPRGETSAGPAPPSDADAPQGAMEREGESEHATARAASQAERDRFWHQRFILDWLIGDRPGFPVFKALGIDATRVNDADVERIALAMRPTYVKGVASLVRWAKACNAGDVAQKPPITTVRELMERLADPARRPLMERQLALLAAKDDEFRNHPNADDDGDSRTAA